MLNHLSYEDDSVAKVIEKLAFDEDDGVKETFFSLIEMGYVKTSADFRVRVLKNANLFIRFLAHQAYDKVISQDDLIEMVSSQNLSLRLLVCENENTPYEVLMMLAKDESLDVRASLLMKQSLPSNIRESLESDDVLMDYYQDHYL